MILIIKKCQDCGKEFDNRNSHISIEYFKKQKYCSRVCRNKFLSNLAKSNIGKKLSMEHRKHLSEAKLGKTSNAKGIHWTMAEDEKQRRAERMKKYLKENGHPMKGMKMPPLWRKHISDEHKKAVKEGRCHLWRGGITQKNLMVRSSFEYRLWREGVFSRDDYTCQKCKSRGGRLHAHHIYNFSKWIPDRFDMRNGITLCIKCHQIFHKEYGISNNNIFQFLLFTDDIDMPAVESILMAKESQFPFPTQEQIGGKIIGRNFTI